MRRVRLEAEARRIDALVDALTEKRRRQRETWRRVLDVARHERVITPEAVEAYAALLLTTDDGVPLRPAAHHWLWLQLLCDRRIKKLLIIAPPESAKTTWVISAYAGCRVALFPEESLIIGSVSSEVAENRSLSLRSMVETEVWQQTFPGVLPIKARDGGMKWETTRWSLAYGGVPRPGRIHPTVAAYGTGGSIIGSRANEIIGDDLHDEENSRTKHQRDLVKRWAHTSLLSRRKSRVGRATLIGTAWHPDDLYAEWRQAKDVVTCHVPLLSEGEEVTATLTYPDGWPHEMLGDPIGYADTQLLAA